MSSRRKRVAQVAAAAAAWMVVSCGSGSDPATAPSVTVSTTAEPTFVTTATAPAPAAVPRAVSVVTSVPHDPAAFTQGLVFDESGRLFESTGLAGQSTVREVDPVTGDVLREHALDPALFGEGLALVDDRLVQLTYQNGRAIVYDKETFEQLETFEYEGEGWGLCFDGDRLVMSDGTDVLAFRDPTTFAVEGSLNVTVDNAPLTQLNELECADGVVYANVWRTNTLVRIDPASGRVERVLDATSLGRPATADVLNGIAIEPDGDVWLTGKLWDAMYQVRVDAP